MTYNLKFLIRHFRLILSVAVLVAGIILSYVVFAQDLGSGEPTDEELRVAGITFPIAELGNCASKSECHDYCNDTANMGVCISFAKAHGLMNETEAAHAEQFRGRMESEGGPGGCRSPVDCEAYCSNITHIEECIAFADEQGFDEPEIKEARKIAAYLRAGGEMPGGCTSEASCMEYCGDFSHARECFEFATRAGLAQEDEFGDEDDIPSPEQFQKLIELTERGETPGGCQGRLECESYCRDSAHFEECIAFGEKMGFIGPEEAAMARRTGGVGPGGCNSHESCTAYCNNPANQESCFKFAEDHGLIPEDELRHAREGFVSLRQGLEQAPPEVHACLRSVLGPNIIEDIQAQRLTPGPEIGERVRGCFEDFGHRNDPREAFGDAPPEVIACLQDKLGVNTFSGIRSGEIFPTPEMGDVFRVCFESVRFEEKGFFSGSDGPGEFGGPPPQEIRNFIRSAPPEVKVCLREKLGGDLERLGSGDASFPPEFGEYMRGCFESFGPPEHEGDESFRPPGFQPGVPPSDVFEPRVAPLDFSNLPPEVIECVKSTVGVNLLDTVRGEELTPDIGERVKLCFEKLQSNIAPFPRPGDSVVCIQVITPAHDPATGVCKKFSTPCDVPSGWLSGCPVKSDLSLPPTTVVEPTPEPTTIQFDPVEECTKSGGTFILEDGSCVLSSTETGGGSLLDATKRFLFGR
ncbi:MAG: hypothetical protein KJI72_02810 [Patescibacteria group bacterium]|nr:hypothetical protein [Patescibacteria group bacterium]